MTDSPMPPESFGLPFTEGPIRFAVGDPNGLSSNSWRFWTTGTGDAYLKCRDNFTNTKVSLHASGRWRMGFTQEAVAADPNLVAQGEDRAWEVWDQPPPNDDKALLAFRLVFPTSELAVRPDLRTKKKWSGTVFIEAAPESSDAMTVISLVVAPGRSTIDVGHSPSFVLAELPLNDHDSAYLVAHAEPLGETPSRLGQARRAAAVLAETAGIEVPEGSYYYFFGRRSDGSRFVVGARALHEAST